MKSKTTQIKSLEALKAAAPEGTRFISFSDSALSLFFVQT
jgi:hypothetical protein